MKKILFLIVCTGFLLISCSSQDNISEVNIASQSIEPDTSQKKSTPSTSDITDQIIDEIEEDNLEKKAEVGEPQIEL